MGAWGFGALDSDGALDWLGNTIDGLLAERLSEMVNDFDSLEENFGSDHRGVERWAHELRAAGHLLVVLAEGNIYMEDHPVGFNPYLTIADRLAACMAADDWIGSWSEPEAVKLEMQGEIGALLAAEQQANPPHLRTTTNSEGEPLPD